MEFHLLLATFSIIVPIFPNRRITYQLALVPVILIFSLAFIVHGMPPQESAVDAPTLSGRDDTANYVIYPKDVDNQDQAKAIQTLVESVKPGDIYVSSSDHGAITWFWGVSLTSENAEKVRADPNVRMCSHFRSKGSRTDRSRSLQLFKNAQRIVMIRQRMINPARNRSAQTIVPRTRRYLAS